ncbi:MAG: four helix bundle protein [Pseudomonadota bacterium]
MTTIAQETREIRSFTDLRVWQEARILVKQVYEICAHFPSGERYGLSTQLQRAAVSAVANIAEGSDRYSIREYIHHLSIAQGSLSEVHALLILASDLNFAPNEAIDERIEQSLKTGRMLRKLQQSLRNRIEHRI